MAINTNITLQGFVLDESAFNDTTYVSGFGATNVFDFDRLTLTGALNRTIDRSRRGTPDTYATRDQRPTAEWDLVAPWKPSGTLGTPSGLSTFLRRALGSRTAPNLATTIASGASATGATLTSGTGLAVGDCMVITMPAGHREATRLKTVAGAAVTWDALSTAPSVSAAAVSGVNYKLTTAAPSSVTILKAYVDNTDQEVVTGAMVNDLTITFAGSDVVMISASGPAARLRTSGATVPGSTTFLAGEALASFDGNNYIDGNAFLLTRMVLNFRGGLAMRNSEIGTRYASGVFRSDFRELNVEVEYYFEDTDIRTAAEAVTKTVIRHIAGNTNGNMLGCVIPKVEWERPRASQADNGAVMVTASGKVIATSGNDTAFLFEA